MEVGTIFQISVGQINKPLTKGHFITGGSISIDFEKTREYDQLFISSPQTIYYTNANTFETDLYCGYFLINQLALGLKTDLSTSSTKRWSGNFPGTTKFIYNNLSFGPFFRYYTRQGLFFEGFTSIGLLKTVNVDDKENWKNYAYGAGIGYSLFITNSIAVEPELKYVHSRIPHYVISGYYMNDEKSNDLNFSIGFQIYLNAKKEDGTK